MQQQRQQRDQEEFDNLQQQSALMKHSLIETANLRQEDALLTRSVFVAISAKDKEIQT